MDGKSLQRNGNAGKSTLSSPILPMLVCSRLYLSGNKTTHVLPIHRVFNYDLGHVEHQRTQWYCKYWYTYKLYTGMFSTCWASIYTFQQRSPQGCQSQKPWKKKREWIGLSISNKYTNYELFPEYNVAPIKRANAKHDKLLNHKNNNTKLGWVTVLDYSHYLNAGTVM